MAYILYLAGSVLLDLKGVEGAKLFFLAAGGILCGIGSVWIIILTIKALIKKEYSQ